MLTCSAIIAADLLTVEELPIMKNIVLRSLLTRMINIKITGGAKIQLRLDYSKVEYIFYGQIGIAIWAAQWLSG